jgi:peptide chain release factor 1
LRLGPTSLDGVLDRLAGLKDEYALVEVRLGDPAVLADQSQLVPLSRRYKELGPIVDCIGRFEARREDLAAAKEMFSDAAGDDREMMRGEITEAEADIEALEEELRVLLIPRDPNDGKNVIVEIRGAEGGEEANLFARDLYDMYVAWFGRRGWKLEPMSVDLSDLGGINQITFMVKGEDAWTHLKYEGGPHRVQRVPATESQGRVHTSSATVVVFPEAEEVELEIDDKDLQIDVYRSSGAGGQHVNTTDSAVRITHKPSGVVVAMQDERSQLQNKARAMQVLRSRLVQLEKDRVAAETTAGRKLQIGGGGRSEKIRTYNYKENRITDHRIGLTLYKLQVVLAGDLDEVVEALITEERAAALSGDD